MRLKKPIVAILLACLMGVMLFALTACNDDDFRNERNGEPEAGQFYTLQKAYDNGWLSKGDLRNIAYHKTGDAQKKGFTPTPKNPAELSPETVLEIKKSYTIRHKEDQEDYETVLERVRIEFYYGVYGGLIAVYMYDPGVNVPTAIKEQTIGGVYFEYPDLTFETLVYKPID